MAVAREVREETGIEVGAVQYHPSQPWPFLANIMLGFHAAALTTEITVDYGARGCPLVRARLAAVAC
jgi:NAD+ diphosphatase